MELARSIRLSPIAFNIALNVVSGFTVVDHAFSTFLICSCSCIIAVSASWTLFLTSADSLSNYCSIHCSLSSVHKTCISRRFSANSVFFDDKLPNAPHAQMVSASGALLHLFAWWCRPVDFFVDLPYLPAGSCKRFFCGALTIVSCVELVVGRHIGCCKIWTTWRLAASFMSRLVGFINQNKAKSAFWLSLHLE